MKLYTQDMGISPTDIGKSAAAVDTYRAHLESVMNKTDYAALESSLHLPLDASYRAEIMEMVNKKKTKALKYVVVVGIGGSNLGTKAIYEAVHMYRDMFDATSNEPRMFFLDTVDPEMTGAFVRFMKKNVHVGDEILVVIISKSGGTTETLVNAEIILKELRETALNWKDRCVVITDFGSRLWKEADTNGISALRIPQLVGGRYSVFSAVGLFPLALCGIDTDALMKGAREALTKGIGKEVKKNDSLLSAIFLDFHARHGKNIADTFLFHTELESLGKWYRQLMGESIGKDGKGISPTVTVGSIDHHSIVQLYLGGPADKSTTFLYTKSSERTAMPKHTVLALSTPFAGRDEAGIMDAIRKGTAEAYKKQQRPFVQIELEQISEYELGWFMQFKMMEMMFLGKLLGVNAFDQPHVELYKIETKKMLDLQTD
jgi:glucose-6-phosphate isomerase